MKILIIGGIASSLINFRSDLIKDILAAGHSVHTASGETSEDDRRQLKALGVIHHSLALSRAKISIISDLKLFFEIFDVCREYKPDLVFCYTIKPATIGVLAAWFAGIRQISAMITGLGYAFEGGSAKKALLSSMVSALYRVSLRRCKVVIFQNPDDEAYFRKNGLLSRYTSVGLVNGSGVNIERFENMPQPESVEFLMIGRLLKTKGVEEYVEAAREVKKIFPEVVFSLLGDTDPNPASILKETVEKWISEGVINFSSWLDDVRPSLAKCSVYVLPSYREGLPRTVIEAMACGRPIITTDVPGCRDTLLHDASSTTIANPQVIRGENGLLVPPKNVEALKDAMIYLILHMEDRLTMGFRSREIALEKYDVHKVNRKMRQYLGF